MSRSFLMSAETIASTSPSPFGLFSNISTISSSQLLERGSFSMNVSLSMLPPFYAETAFCLTPLFSGALVAQRKGHPVEGRQARNELEQLVICQFCNSTAYRFT